MVHSPRMDMAQERVRSSTNNAVKIDYRGLCEVAVVTFTRRSEVSAQPARPAYGLFGRFKT